MFINQIIIIYYGSKQGLIHVQSEKTNLLPELPNLKFGPF